MGTGEQREAEFAVLGGVLSDFFFFPGSANWSSGKFVLLRAGAPTLVHPKPAGWEWEWGTAGVGELDEQRVMGRAASSVSPLVSIGIMALSSSQAAGEAAQGRDGRAGEPGDPSVPRSWLH